MKMPLADFTMAYEDTGRGPPLLLIHGFPLGRRLWRPQLENLLGVARVIAPDLRGHGDSEAVPGPYTMELLADDCHALLRECGVDQPVVVCGLSMGGYVAMAFARKYPEQVAGLVLAATRASADTTEGRAGRDRSIAVAREKGVEAIVDGMLPKLLAPDTLAQRKGVVDYARKMMLMTSAEGMVGALEGMKTRPDMTEWLRNFGKPTLILHGAEDEIIPPRDAEALREVIPGAALQLIPNAGHLLNLEQPAIFNAALRQFLRSVTGADEQPQQLH